MVSWATAYMVRVWGEGGVWCEVLGEHMTMEAPGDIHVEEAGWWGGDGDTQRPQLFIDVMGVRWCVRVCVGGWLG